MAYDEHFAERIAQALKRQHVSFEEKKMFGGIGFMVNDKMCVGILKDSLLVKIDPEQTDAVLKKKGCHVMNFGGRIMKGFVGIDPDAVDKEKDLDQWVSFALEYNKPSKPATKKKAPTKK